MANHEEVYELIEQEMIRERNQLRDNGLLLPMMNQESINLQNDEHIGENFRLLPLMGNQECVHCVPKNGIGPKRATR